MSTNLPFLPFRHRNRSLFLVCVPTVPILPHVVIVCVQVLSPPLDCELSEDGGLSVTLGPWEQAQH